MAAPVFRALLAEAKEASSVPAGTDTTVSITVASGDKLLIFVVFRDAGDTDQTTSSVVFNTSESATLLGQSNNTGGNTNARHVSAWKLENPTATTANLVVTYSEAVAGAVVIVLAYTGVHSFGAVSAGGLEAGNNSSANGRLALLTDLVTTAVDSLAVACLACQRGTTAHSPFTPDAGTDRADSTTGSNATNDMAYEVCERAAATIGSYAFGSNTNDAATTPAGGSVVAVEIRSVAPVSIPAVMQHYLGMRSLGI